MSEEILWMTGLYGIMGQPLPAMAMLKNDIWIREQGTNLIDPFVRTLIRRAMHNQDLPVISYGVSSYGYDIRLSPHDFRIFRHVPGTVIDPKNFNPDNLEAVELQEDESGLFFILPAHSYGLGVALERLTVPGNISVLCIGKSTYARVGVIANLTPAEAGWRGHLTLEISNSSSADCRIYANEGIVQLLFLEGEPCDQPYGDRKYQNQGATVTLARV